VVSRGGARVTLSDRGRGSGSSAAHAVVRRILEGDAQVYGVNTGFGHLKDIRIPHDRLEALQLNLNPQPRRRRRGRRSSRARRGP
jgi:histidine ammonia-lyase